MHCFYRNPARDASGGKKEMPPPNDLSGKDGRRRPEAEITAQSFSILPGRSGKACPHLLIVEDNADVVRYLSTILEGEYRIDLAANGRDGLELALRLVPDLIISDVMMPLMDGFTLCRTLKTDQRTSHIPVILLTAKAAPASR